MEQILDIKYNFNESNNSVVVSVKITNGYSIEWITNINVNGVDNFYLTDRSIFKSVLTDSPSDRMLIYLNNNILTEYYGYTLDDTLISQLKDRPNELLKALYSIPRLSEEEAIKSVMRIMHKIITKVVIKLEEYQFNQGECKEFYNDTLTITTTKMKYERIQSNSLHNLVLWEIPLKLKGLYNISKEVQRLRKPIFEIIDSGEYEIYTYRKDNSYDYLKATGSLSFNGHGKLAHILRSIIPNEYFYSPLIKGNNKKNLLVKDNQAFDEIIDILMEIPPKI